MLEGGDWTVVWIPVGDLGKVQRGHVRVFGERITPEWLERRADESD